MKNPTGILLIGGGGFIGQSLALHLARTGNDVHVLSRRDPSKLTLLASAIEDTTLKSKIEYHQGSQEDARLVQVLLELCPTVVHLASTTNPSSSMDCPTREGHESILPALRLIETMRLQPPNRLLFISSGGTLYGDTDELPAKENQPLRPRSYHGAAKASLEHFFGAFAAQTVCSFTALRPSNVYGPGQPLLGGFGLVRHLLECARTGQTLQIWGDGESSRDFIFIDDFLTACAALIPLQEQQGPFNVGTGIATTINELREMVEQVTSRKMMAEYVQHRNVDVRAITLNSQRLTVATEWQPRVSILEGLRKTWTWRNP